MRHQLILEYAAGQDFDALAANVEKQDAILRGITIIGEATKRLSNEFRLQHPEIPWKQMAGMRDVVTHDYDEVDLDDVWGVIQRDLPQLLTDIEPLVISEQLEVALPIPPASRVLKSCVEEYRVLGFLA